MTDKNKEHIRAEFQKRLQSSLTAYGSNGAVIFEFIKDFKEDWQTDLYNIAKLLEYSDGVDGLIALMKSFPNDVVVEELPSGLVRFKPVPTVTTIENLNLIDQSNKEIAEHKERKIRLNQRQNPIHIRLSSVPPPIYPPQIFNQSHPISQNGQSVPPHLLPPYHRGYIPSSKPRVKQPISENANLIDLGVRAPLSQRQNGTGHQSRNKTNLLNGKEERMRDGRSSPPSFSRASTPRVISLHSSINDLTELEQAEREFSMKLGKGRPILGQTFEPLISDDEDFRVPASDDESTLTDVSSRIGSVSSLDNPIDSNKQSGTVTADLSRLLYLFQLNDGSLSSSKIDDLKRSYEREFGCALSSKELNRLLGCPPNIRIVGESFKKASYPASSFFRVIQSDSSSSLYTVKLRRCLTGEFIDPSIYFAKLPSRVVSRTSTPLPKISSISTITRDKIYILDIRNCPKLKKNNLISTASFNGFRSGNKLRVKILSVVSNGDAKLELCQLSSKLRLLLSDYSDLLEIIEEQPTKCLTPDSKRMVFFYDRSKRLRRGYITKKENESSVSIKDLDILDIQDHLVLNNCVFDVPENFPIWQFPACQFQAQIVNADMIQIRRFWKEGTEFSVIVNEIINGQKCFCRPLPINSMDVVDF
uniref:Uncharacterized protein n=1 Tax=Meloidogyne javanica TaxID=6303 RepID=A0A915LZQ8_MELJA